MSADQNSGVALASAASTGSEVKTALPANTGTAQGKKSLPTVAAAAILECVQEGRPLRATEEVVHAETVKGQPEP